MGRKAEAANRDKLFSSVLERFDEHDKEDLALELVDELDLDEDGPPLRAQIERLLDRKLTEGERFKVDVLENILNHHTGAGESEEEEEE